MVTRKPKVKFVWFRRRFIAFFIDRLIYVIPIVGWIINLVFYFRDWQTIWYKVIWAKIYHIEGNKLYEASPGTLIGRAFAKILSSIAFWLGFVRISRDEKKKWRHDHIAETVVVQETEPNEWLAILLFVLWLIASFIIIALSVASE